MVQFTKGRTTGLGVHAAVVQLLRQNERKRLSDAELAKWLVREFPKRKSAMFASLRAGVLARVQQWRTRYNRGDLTGHVSPATKSNRYVRRKVSNPIYSGKKGVCLVSDAKAARKKK